MRFTEAPKQGPCHDRASPLNQPLVPCERVRRQVWPGPGGKCLPDPLPLFAASRGGTDGTRQTHARQGIAAPACSSVAPTQPG